jgi:hypothetical protein
MMSFNRYGRFFVTAVSVNWGRGYEARQFKHDLLNVMRFVDNREHVILFPQELDEEPDLSKEHNELDAVLEPGTKKIFWNSHEPIIVSPTFRVVNRRRVVTMGAGKELDKKFDGVGPRRYGVTAVVELEGIRLGLGNTHPHRNIDDPLIRDARTAGLGIWAEELRRVKRSNGGISGIWGADMNAKGLPKLVGGEKVAIDKGLDHLHYWQHHNGAKLTLMEKGSLNGTIDPHDPLWARFLVEAR